ADDGSGAGGAVADLTAASPITFSDGAATSAEQMGAGLSGSQDVCQANGVCTFAPDPGAAAPGNLSKLAGETVAGTWKLCVGDGAAVDVGVVQQVTLTIK